MKSEPGSIQTAVLNGLPGHARWILRGTPLDFDFSEARRGVRRLTPDEVGGDAPHEWSDLLVFGSYDYADGGGACPWLAVRCRDGAVCGLDVEREPERATFILNSSIGRFIDTFVTLGQYLRNGYPLPSDIRGRVRDIDPDAYPVSEWRLLIEHVSTA